MDRGILENFKHLRQQTARMLQIGIHAHRKIGADLFKTCQHGRFLAEIAGKGQIGNTSIFFGKDPDLRQGVVAASIIHEQDVPGYVPVFHHGRNFIVKQRDTRFLIEARNDDRQ